MSEDWHIVQTYNTATDAHLAKMNLDRAGVPGLLEDLNMGMLHSPGVSGIKVLVRAQDLDRARELLKQPHLHLLEDDEG